MKELQQLINTTHELKSAFETLNYTRKDKEVFNNHLSSISALLQTPTILKYQEPEIQFPIGFDDKCKYVWTDWKEHKRQLKKPLLPTQEQTSIDLYFSYANYDTQLFCIMVKTAITRGFEAIYPALSQEIQNTELAKLFIEVYPEKEKFISDFNKQYEADKSKNKKFDLSLLYNDLRDNSKANNEKKYDWLARANQFLNYDPDKYIVTDKNDSAKPNSNRQFSTILELLKQQKNRKVIEQLKITNNGNFISITVSNKGFYIENKDEITNISQLITNEIKKTVKIYDNKSNNLIAEINS